MTEPKDEPRVLSYLAVRRFLGFLGLCLPLVLAVYALLPAGAMQTSISAFYHTHMGDILVGILCAIGTFLIAYQGYPRKPGEALSDRWVARTSGLAAIGVALFPTTAPEGACPPGQRFAVTAEDRAIEYLCSVQGLVNFPGWLHFACAAAFFFCLALFCFFLFPKGTRRPDGRIDWSAAENRAYFVSGSALVLSILAIGFYAIRAWRDATMVEVLDAYYWIFVWETVGVVAFAVSWLIKGDTMSGIRALMTGRSEPMRQPPQAP